MSCRPLWIAWVCSAMSRVGWNFLTLSGATLADNLPATFQIYRDILLEPHLDEEFFEPVLIGVEQGCWLRKTTSSARPLSNSGNACYDLPWGRPLKERWKNLTAVTADGIRQHFRTCVGAARGDSGCRGQRLGTSCLSAGARSAWRMVRDGSKDSASDSRSRRIDAPRSRIVQTHLRGLPRVAPNHPDLLRAWAASSILGGGSSSRLFTEVRENRGLVYTVYAS